MGSKGCEGLPPRPIQAQSTVCQSEDDYLYIEYSVYTNRFAILLAAAAAVGGGEERIEACSFLSITNRDTALAHMNLYWRRV